ncbi:60S ribosomal protein L24 [Capsicum annuum]|nr:60S ribosomal protein L24 [Capsicum annuum]
MEVSSPSKKLAETLGEEELGIATSELDESGIMIQGFNQRGQRPMGCIKLGIRMDDFQSNPLMHVIDVKTSYNILLGGVERKIFVDDKPFTEAESHFANAKFYLKKHVVDEKRAEDVTKTKCEDLTSKKVAVTIKKVTTKKPFSTLNKESVASTKKRQLPFFVTYRRKIDAINPSSRLLEESVAQNLPQDMTLPTKHMKDGFDPNVYKLFVKAGYNPNEPSSLGKILSEGTTRQNEKDVSSQIKVDEEIEDVIWCYHISVNDDNPQEEEDVGDAPSIVLVRKKNGQIQVYVDFRDLNNACLKDDFSIPIPELMIDSTTVYEAMSFMDGSSGYNQIRMVLKDKELTAFCTPKGIYCYKVMPFGLKNAGATYQKAMQNIFDGLLHKNIECYVDDLVVKSRKRDDHLKDLRMVFELLRRYQLRMNPLKCAFGVTSGKFLVFIMRHQGIDIDQYKELSDEIPNEDAMAIEVRSPLKMYFDGAAHRDGAGVGVVFVTPQAEVIPYSFTLVNRCSNNVVEYQALILGLEMVVNMKQLQLQVFEPNFTENHLKHRNDPVTMKKLREVVGSSSNKKAPKSSSKTKVDDSGRPRLPKEGERNFSDVCGLLRLIGAGATMKKKNVGLFGYVAEISHYSVRTELCRFSGAKIYPGRGIRFIRSDSQVFLFVNSKCKHYFHNKLKPSKLTWTAMYRKQHKKDIAQEAAKKRRRTTKKPYSRSIVGATLEVIQKKRTERPEVRDAAREAALREIKERIKKTKDEKKAKKAEVQAKSQKTVGKGNVSRGGASKGPKLGGGEMEPCVVKSPVQWPRAARCVGCDGVRASRPTPPRAHPIVRLEFRVKDDDVFGARVMGKATISAKKIVHAVYAEYLSEGLGIPSSGIDVQYHRMRYATLLCKYDSVKTEK